MEEALERHKTTMQGALCRCTECGNNKLLSKFKIPPIYLSRFPPQEERLEQASMVTAGNKIRAMMLHQQTCFSCAVDIVTVREPAMTLKKKETAENKELVDNAKEKSSTWIIEHLKTLKEDLGTRGPSGLSRPRCCSMIQIIMENHTPDETGDGEKLAGIFATLEQNLKKLSRFGMGQQMDGVKVFKGIVL